MLMLPTQRLRVGRLPWDPPLRLWGPTLLWQLLCWPIVGLGDAIRRSRAAGGDGRPVARGDLPARADQAGGRGQHEAGVSWWRALVDRLAIALVASGGALTAIHIVQGLEAPRPW